MTPDIKVIIRVDILQNHVALLANKITILFLTYKLIAAR